MPYKNTEQKIRRQKQRRDEAPTIIEAPKGEAPVKMKPLAEAPRPIVHGTKTIYVTAEKAAKLLMVCQALDKQISGLQGKENLLNMVRYGVSGPTMAGVKESLGG